MLDRKYLDLLVVAIFTALIVSIPWETIQGRPFTDRTEYLNYFLFEKNVLDYKELDNQFPYNIISYLSSEVLWHFGIRELIDGFNVPIEIVFGAISSLCIGVFSFYLVRNNHRYFSLILLINPLVIVFAFSQLRLALAFSFLGFAYYCQRKSIAAILIICALFIHTSVMLFIIMYLCSNFIINWANNKKYFQRNTYYMSLVGTGILVALIIGPLREGILNYLGDRRAEYHDMSSTLLFSLFWIGLLFPMYVQNRHYLTKINNAYIIVILSIVTANVAFAGYSTRFIAATFPMIVSSILTMRGLTKIGVLSLFVIYSIFQWLYWILYS